MSSTKFYIYGGRRWRELSLDGRVEGWGYTTFLVARGGQLEVVKRKTVLQGLKDLAAGRPTTVLDGLPLSQIRLNDNSKYKVKKKPKKHCQHCQQCEHRCMGLPAEQNSYPQCNTNTAPIQKATATIATQCVLNTDVFNNSHIATAGSYKPLNNVVHEVNHRTQNDQYNHQLPSTSYSTSRNQLNSRDRNKLKPTKKPLHWEQRREREKIKELIIEEEDVMLLRRFIEVNDNGMFGVDLLKFDEDDNYKQRVFYGLNPVIDIERSATIERMLRQQRCRSRDVSLSDFVTVLGLRSVDERSTPVSRPRTRSTIQKRHTVSSSDHDTDKENSSRQTFRTRARRTQKTQRRLSKEESVNAVDEGWRVVLERRPRTSKTVRAGVNGKLVKMNNGTYMDNGGRKEENVKLSTKKIHNGTYGDSSGRKEEDVKSPTKKINNGIYMDNSGRKEEDVKSPTKKINNGIYLDNGGRKEEDVKFSKKTTKGTLVDSGGRKEEGVKTLPKKMEPKPKSNMREYSTLEDESIIQFVCGEERARLVKGNRLWQELEPLHNKATGHFRSWHSLRNRYLRNLLPRLASFLSPATASRLRADAATGELKSRKGPARRNSLFAAPKVRSAWARRPRTRGSLLTPSPTPLSPRKRRTPSPTPLSPHRRRTSSPTPPSPRRRRTSSPRPSPPRPQRTPSPAGRRFSSSLSPTSTYRPSRSPRPSQRYSPSSYELNFSSNSDSEPRPRKRMRRRSRRSKSGTRSRTRSPRKSRRLQSPAHVSTRISRSARNHSPQPQSTAHGSKATPRGKRTRRLETTPTYSDVTRRYRTRISDRLDAQKPESEIRGKMRRLYDPKRDAL